VIGQTGRRPSRACATGDAVLNNARLKSDPRSVLVVDDDFLQREEIAEKLMRDGMRVLTAANGFAAMHQIRRARPAVVILDLNMPGLDGLEVARLAHGLDHHPELILVSGSAKHISRAHREDLGVFAIVEKPIAFPVLTRFIREAMGEEMGEGPPAGP
jgi:CheY-like chemotaxis protein